MGITRELDEFFLQAVCFISGDMQAIENRGLGEAFAACLSVADDGIFKRQAVEAGREIMRLVFILQANKGMHSLIAHDGLLCDCPDNCCCHTALAKTMPDYFIRRETVFANIKHRIKRHVPLEVAFERGTLAQNALKLGEISIGMG